MLAMGGAAILSSEDYSLFDYVEPEQERQPLWHSVKDNLELKVPFVSGAPAPVGSCEFVGALLYEGSSGRKCTCGGVCFLFADPVAYASCPSRKEKLKE